MNKQPQGDIRGVRSWSQKLYLAAQIVSLLAIPYLAFKCQINKLCAFDVILMYFSVIVGAFKCRELRNNAIG